MNTRSGYRNGQLIYPISVVDHHPKEGGGGGSQPGPNTVGTDEIIDGSIQEEDLNDEVKDRMTITHDSTTGGLRIGGYAKPGDVPADNQDAG